MLICDYSHAHLGVMQEQDAGHAVPARIRSLCCQAGHDQPDCGIQSCKRQYNYTAAAAGKADKLLLVHNDK